VLRRTRTAVVRRRRSRRATDSSSGPQSLARSWYRGERPSGLAALGPGAGPARPPHRDGHRDDDGDSDGRPATRRASRPGSPARRQADKSKGPSRPPSPTRSQAATTVVPPGRPPGPGGHLESCTVVGTPGLWRYVPVRTGTYQYVRLYSTYRYVLLVIFRITVHTSTYWYRDVLVQKNYQKYVRVRTSLCLSRFMAVHGGTWRYMQNSITVYGST
jgi:hypothetical protein